MTTLVNTPYQIFVGDGATTTFAFTFSFETTAEIQVLNSNPTALTQVLLVQNVDYTVTQITTDSNGYNVGATIVFTVAPVVGNLINVSLLKNYGQQLNLTDNSSFSAASLNISLDQLAQQIQVLNDIVKYQCVKITPGLNINTTIPLADTKASSYLWLNPSSQMDATTYAPPIGSTTTGMTAIVQDLSPTLDGNLNTNAHSILFNTGTGLKDNNGNAIIFLNSVSSAVNQFTITNSTTSNNVSLAATGSDTNIGINYTTKGTGIHTFTGPATFSSTLSVTGNTTVNGTLTVVGNIIGNQSITGNLAVSGTLGVTGAATFNSTIVATGNISGANLAASGTLSSVGNFAVNTNKFTVNASTGNTAVAGTFAVTGAATVGGSLGVTGAFSVTTNKFTVDTSGNVTNAGTLTSAGALGVTSGALTVTNGNIINTAGNYQNIVSGKGVIDSNANNVLTYTSVASSANYIDVSNNSFGNNPLLTAKGTDTNISLSFQGKATGCGTYTFRGDGTTNPAGIVLNNLANSGGATIKPGGSSSMTFTLPTNNMAMPATADLGGAGGTLAFDGSGNASYVYSPLLSRGVVLNTPNTSIFGQPGNTGAGNGFRTFLLVFGLTQTTATTGAHTLGLQFYVAGSAVASGYFYSNPGTNTAAASITTTSASATNAQLTNCTSNAPLIVSGEIIINMNITASTISWSGTLTTGALTGTGKTTFGTVNVGGYVAGVTFSTSNIGLGFLADTGSVTGSGVQVFALPLATI